MAACFDTVGRSFHCYHFHLYHQTVYHAYSLLRGRSIRFVNETAVRPYNSVQMLLMISSR
jgi:hypothetical protein